MINKESLKTTIIDLVSNEEYKLSQEILDFYFSKAECIEDIDIIGELCLKSQHHHLRLKCAEYLYTRAVTSKQLFNARENLYTCYNILNYPEKALFYIDLNLKINPNDIETILNKAFSLSLCGKNIESEGLLLNIKTEDEEIKKKIEFGLSKKLLREGKTAKGILTFVNNFKPKNNLFENNLRLKFWDGGIQPGKTIVINGEGGIGDEIINIRFLDNFKKLGMNPILYSSWNKYRPDIVDVFKRHGYNVVTTPYFFKKDYLWTHMLSLPGYLGLTEQELWKGPYLNPLRNQKNKINDKKLKVGIKCSGNPFFEQDIYRSIPTEDLISAIPKEFSVYYFDKEKNLEGTISLKDKLNTWEDTLDYIDQMDIIVSSCTSLVHASGAMGKRTIACVPIQKYYTWTSTRTNNTTPWYGNNFTVIEQTKLRCWKEPLENVNSLLREMI